MRLSNRRTYIYFEWNSNTKGIKMGNGYFSCIFFVNKIIIILHIIKKTITGIYMLKTFLCILTESRKPTFQDKIVIFSVFHTKPVVRTSDSMEHVGAGARSRQV